jgi:hypothetical protein
MPKFMKRPVMVEAIQWTGDNIDEIKAFGGDKVVIVSEYTYGEDPRHNLSVNTMEGSLDAKKHDWIIKGVKGEFYPCDEEVFKLSYIGIVSSPPLDEIKIGRSEEDVTH